VSGCLYVETVRERQLGLYRLYSNVGLDRRRLVDGRVVDAVGVRFIGRRFDRRRARRWKLFRRSR
jgi:hypothetical protein